MADKTVIYMDKVVVHPEFHHQGIALKLYQEMFAETLRIGVKTMFGIIRQDQYHDSSAVQALRMAVGADSIPYTYVVANLDKMKAELEK